jgi:hypothetical protein
MARFAKESTEVFVEQVAAEIQAYIQNVVLQGKG